LIGSDASQDLQRDVPFGVRRQMDDGGGAPWNIHGNGADALFLKQDEVRDVVAQGFPPTLVARFVCIAGERVGERACVDGQAHAATLQDGSAALNAVLM
jgi:hypothetical protein